MKEITFYSLEAMIQFFMYFEKGTKIEYRSTDSNPFRITVVVTQKDYDQAHAQYCADAYTGTVEN